MPLSAGTRLGPYEILEPLGTGGMGEVWKARDTRLNRVVAIKVAKEQFSERFQREAEAVAALNHPHICALYDVGPNYLVMEYVEGAPLKGPMPLEQALKYAGQICEALDAAHRKGITHRDLKPGNILVTKPAGVKLLDFGLARVEGNTDATVTRHGEIAGTPAYMAPEQWEGKPGDVRSDIYAFGCVLYEMLTGKLAAADRRALEPPGLETVVRTCLAQDPEERWQSAREIRATFRMPMTAPARAVRNPWRERAGWVVAAVAALALLGTLILSTTTKRGSTTGNLTRWAFYPPDNAEYYGTPANLTVPVPQFALSPDGRYIVVAAGTADARPLLWLRSTDDIVPRQVAGTEDAQAPFWSPDSRWIGFFAEGKLKKVQASGGTVQVITDEIPDPRGGTWGANDTILYALGNSGIFGVSSAGGTRTAITTLDAARQEAFHRWPYFMPDGQHFLYSIVQPLPEQRGIYLGSLDGVTKKLLINSLSSAVYAPPTSSVSGTLLFLNGVTLMGQAFDTDRLKLTGRAVAIADHVGLSTTLQAAVSATSVGMIAYSASNVRKGRLEWHDREGKLLGTEGVEGDYTSIDLSPDGKRLAVSLVDSQTGVPDIWVDDLVRGGSQRQTFGPYFNAQPVWSPDGSRLVFRSAPLGVAQLVEKSTAGGNQRLLLPLQEGRRYSVNITAQDWSPDGKHLMFSASQGPDIDLWSLTLEGEGTPVKLVQAPGDQVHGRFSPDGSLVAYASNESGRFEVQVRTVSASDQQWLVSTSGGYEPRWRGDGREIYFLSEDRKLMAAAVAPGPTFGVPRALFQTQVAPGVSTQRTHYIATRDGQRFLVNNQSGAKGAVPITVVLNWTARAGLLAPSN